MKDGELPAETEERRDKGAIILLSRLASDNANVPRHRSREEAGVGKGEEIKMQRSRAGSLAIIIAGRNTGAARSGKANRLHPSRNSTAQRWAERNARRDISGHPGIVARESALNVVVRVDGIADFTTS